MIETPARATALESLLTTLGGQPTAVTIEQAEELVRQHFGIGAHAERLTGERDENFRMHVEGGDGYVLRIAHPAEPLEISDLSRAALVHLERVDPALPVQRVCHALDGDTRIQFTDQSQARRSGMLCTYLPGTPLILARRSPAQRESCGRLLARLGQALRSFEHSGSRRDLLWDLRHLPRLAPLLQELPDLAAVDFLTDFVARFASAVAPRLASVRRQFVHNDFNARNIIVDASDESRVTGIIDFGDSVHTALIADVAVGAVGQLSDAQTADEAIQHFVRAYCEVEPLDRQELALLPWLIAGRIVQNVVITSWRRARDPEDAHFKAFGPAFFEWRVELAKRLVSGPEPFSSAAE
jgi:hydroxylysine kinase